jgi:hypothetical protein
MKKLQLFLLLTISITFSGCSLRKNETQPNKDLEYDLNKNQINFVNYEKKELNYFKTDYISSPSLRNNKLGDPDTQPVRIFLPPSYYNSQKRYPVVYYLHSYGSSFLEIDWYKNAYKEFNSSSNTNEFILVCVNGRNRFDGSFYANSPVSGNWEDFVVKDVVSFIDGKYRTIAKPDSRGICGFSMGGLGAINIVFKNSDVFSCIFAISPGIFDDRDIKEVLKTWNSKMISGYGTAFAPNFKKTFPHVDTPNFDNSHADNEIIARWLSGGGNLNTKVTKNINSIRKLTGIQIEYGTKDYFDWIPDGCKLLSNVLNENRVENKLIEFEGSHGDKNDIIVRRDVFPYFSRLLKAK